MVDGDIWSDDPVPVHPSALRNREPILEVLRGMLPEAGTVLEVGSASGAHAVYFAQHLPHLRWQPSDLEAASLEALELRRAHHGLPNLAAPLLLDASQESWPLTEADAVYCGNVIHISPWSASLGLLAGAARLLPPGGPLITYGPYRIGGEHTAPSNASFDQSLRARDSAWGVRDLEALEEAAAKVGLSLEERVAMPANNFVLLFRRGG